MKILLLINNLIRRKLLPILPILVLVFVIGPVTAQKNTRIAEDALPKWVLEKDIPSINQERLREVDNGIYYLVDDTQIKVKSNGSDRFRRITMKAIDRSGLEEAAQIQLTYEPEISNIVLHRAAVWRDGKLIDQTSTASVEILRREAELDDGIVNGNLTALVRLDDVRVDDVIDFAWSVNDNESYWPGHFFGQYSLGWSVPVAFTRLRLITPESMKVSVKNRNNLPEPERAVLDQSQVLTWEIIDPDPILSESDTPEWFTQNPVAELSTMPNWSEVVDWAQPLYEVDSRLPIDLARKIDAIAEKSDDPKVRATEALWLVQDSIRYTSLSLGFGGFRPRDPSVTWESGFGDCKDKTALLIAVLGRLDISAVPALTDTQEGPGLDAIQPRANAFNHVIVRVDGFDKPIWLDPTNAHQGGVIPSIADLTYGFALPLKAGQNEMEAIPVPVPDEPTVDVVESHVRTEEGIKINIVEQYKKDEADIKRSSLANSSITSLEKEWLDFFEAIYPGLRVEGEMTVDDDRRKNVLSIESNYFLPANAEDYDETILAYQIYGWTLVDLYEPDEASQRETPVELPYQINRRHVINLTIPEMNPWLPDDETISGKAFEFNRLSSRNGDTSTIEMRLVGNATLLDASDFDTYRQNARRLENLSYDFIDLDDPFGWAGLPLMGLSVALYVIGGSVLLFRAVQAVKKTEAEGKDTGQFRAEGFIKFLLMSSATFGFYIYYWFWRSWRRHWRTDAPNIMPFWRAVFSIFWVYPLFKLVNDRSASPLAPFIGVAIAAIYILCAMLSAFTEYFPLPAGIEIVAIIIGFLILLPIIRQINLLNTSEILESNSLIHTRHWVAVVCGTPFTIVYVLSSI